MNHMPEQYPAPGNTQGAPNPMGGELFTVTSKTFYTDPAGRQRLRTLDVKEHQPFLPVRS